MILFKSINKIIPKNEIFVNVSLFILIVVKILQETDHITRQQRIKLLNTQIIKRMSNDVFSKINRNDNQFLQKTKIDKNSAKKNNN